MSTSPGSRIVVPFVESLPLAAVLFAFWVVLSGKLDAFHLGAGVVASLAIAYASCGMYAVDPGIVPRGRHPFFVMPWIRLVLYVPWLAWQILVAAFQVAKLVLSPRADLSPRVFTLEHPLPHNMARATLANSITLTPGTVTLDVRGDVYVVHGLNDEAESGLTENSPTGMPARLSALFEDTSS